MKKILIISTGGTIASKLGEQGLEPQLLSSDLLKYMDSLNSRVHFEHEDILHLDSSNIQPEQWILIAEKVYENLNNFDGIIITHGTDTMGYTASALSFMLGNLKKSVVLTGSQLPIENIFTDGLVNLHTAVGAIEYGIKGVTVAFNRKIIAGTRAVKVSTMEFDAFDSINAAYMGQIYADGMRVFSDRTAPIKEEEETTLNTSLSTDVFILKLLPGTKPEIFDALASLGYKGVIIEAFGAGGMHYMQRDLLDKLEMLTEKSIAVAVCSQCLYERSDLSVYEVGQRMLDKGVLSCKDMTTEAAATKMMWALGQTRKLDEIAKIFETNYVGEITL